MNRHCECKEMKNAPLPQRPLFAIPKLSEKQVKFSFAHDIHKVPSVSERGRGGEEEEREKILQYIDILDIHATQGGEGEGRKGKA